MRAWKTSGRSSGAGLAAFRRAATPISAVVLFFFGHATVAPAMAWAQTTGNPAAPVLPDSLSGVRADAVAKPIDANEDREVAVPPDATAPPNPGLATRDKPTKAATPTQAVTQSPTSKPVVENQADALPTGADKSGVTSKAISLPQGSGKIQGMGESFSTQLSTGSATFSVPFSLSTARGAAQPSLDLAYSSGGGFGLAGVGWDVGVPFIARQTDRGLPNYADQAGFYANQDRFVFNGGQELVPIC